MDVFNSKEDDFEFLDREDLDTRIESSLDPSLVASLVELKKVVHF